MFPAPPPIQPRPRIVRQSAAWKCCVALALLSTALKLCLLLSPSKHVSPAWVFLEEQHRGNIAQEILQGPLLAIQDYQHAPNVGGSVVVGVLAVPFVGLFGRSIAAVRAVPILFNALAVVLLFLILDRHVSRRAAWIGGVLFACAPPGYSLLAITAFGTHVENNALTLASLALFLELHMCAVGGAAAGVESRARERWLALSFGLVAGFALYFGYFFALALGAMLVFELLHDKLFFARRWFRFAVLGFSVGFAPWVSYNLASGFSGLEIYDLPLTTRISLANLLDGGWTRIELLLTDQIPNSFFFRGFSGRDDLGERAADVIVALVLLALVAFLAWRSRAALVDAMRSIVSLRFRPKDLGASVCFLVYLPIFVLAFAATDVGVGAIGALSAHEGRYAAPLFPFLCLIAGCALDAAGHVLQNGRKLGTFVASALAGLCVIGTLSVCDVRRAGESLRRPGTSDEQLARWMSWTWRTDVRRLDRIVSGLQTRRTPEVADGMIFALAQGLKWGMTTQDPADPKGREKAKRNAAALRFLHDRVADAYKAYCEPPIPGEKIYGYKERAQFWKSYRFRQRAQRVRDALALTTPAS